MISCCVFNSVDIAYIVVLYAWWVVCALVLVAYFVLFGFRCVFGLLLHADLFVYGWEVVFVG